MSDHQDSIPRLSAARARRERRARLMSQSLPELATATPKRSKNAERISRYSNRNVIPEESPAKPRASRNNEDSSMSTFRSFFTRIGWNSSSTPRSKNIDESHRSQTENDKNFSTPSKSGYACEKEPAQHPHYLGETPLIRRQQPAKRNRLGEPARFSLNELASHLGPPKMHAVAPDGSPIKDLPPITWDSNESMSIINAYKQALERQLKLEKREKAKAASQNLSTNIVSTNTQQESNVVAETIPVSEPIEETVSEHIFNDSGDIVDNEKRKLQELSPTGASPVLKRGRVHTESPKPKFFEQLDQLLKSPNVKPASRKNRRSMLANRAQDIPKIPLKVHPALELKDITDDRKRKGGFFMADIDYSDEEVPESPKKKVRRMSDVDKKEKLLPANGIKINMSSLADDGRYIDKSLMKEDKESFKSESKKLEEPTIPAEPKIPLPKFIMDDNFSNDKPLIGLNEKAAGEQEKMASKSLFGDSSLKMDEKKGATGFSLSAPQNDSSANANQGKSLFSGFGMVANGQNANGQSSTITLGTATKNSPNEVQNDAQPQKKRLFAEDNDSSMKPFSFGASEFGKGESLFGGAESKPAFSFNAQSQTTDTDDGKEKKSSNVFNFKENAATNASKIPFSFGGVTDTKANGSSEPTEKKETAVEDKGKSLFGSTEIKENGFKGGFTFGKPNSSSFGFGNPSTTSTEETETQSKAARTEETNQKAPSAFGSSSNVEGGFSFGSKAENKSSESKPSFSFGASAASNTTSEAPKSLFGSTATSFGTTESSSFGFGSTANSDESAKPVTSAPGPGQTTNATAVQTSFGGNAGTEVTKAPTSQFTFGSTDNSASSGAAPFSFGNKKNETDKKRSFGSSSDGNDKIQTKPFGSTMNGNSKSTSLFGSDTKATSLFGSNQFGVEKDSTTENKLTFGTSNSGFGSAVNSQNEKPIQSTPFSFSQSTEKSTETNTTTNAPFTFGQPTAGQAIPNETAKPAFTFGGGISSSNETNPSPFGSNGTQSNPAATNPSNPFNFGNKSTEPSRSSAPPFAFGGNGAAFGSTQANTETDQRSSQPPGNPAPFSFGNSQPSQPTNTNAFNMNTVPSFNFGNNNTSSTSGFTFGASSQPLTAPSSMMAPQNNAFAPPNTANNMFAPVPDGGAGGRRKIIPLPRRRRNA